MTKIIDNQYWAYGKLPDIHFDFLYEMERSGTDMRYKFRWVFHSLNTPTSGFGWPIYGTVQLDGVNKLNGITLKASQPVKWYGSEITYESDWVVVSNKLTGTTSYKMTLFSGSGMERTQSWTGTLEVADLASSIIADDFYIGSTLNVTINRIDPTYKHTLVFDFGTLHYQYQNIQESYNLSTTLSWCNQIQDKDSGDFKITLTTFDSNGVQVGEPKEKIIQAKVPASVVPTMRVVLSPVDGFNGKYLSGKSRLNIQTNARPSYSQIKNIAYTVDGSLVRNTEDLNITTDVLQKGTVEVEVVVTDARNRTAKYKGSVNVLEYTFPTIKAKVFRCTASGSFSESGTYISCTPTATFDSTIPGNTVTITASYMALPNGYYADEVEIENGATTVCFDGNVLLNSSYSIRILATDSVGTIAEFYSTVASSSNYMLTANGKKICIGGYVDPSKSDGLQVVGDLHVTGRVMAKTNFVRLINENITAGMSKYVGTDTDYGYFVVVIAKTNNTARVTEFIPAIYVDVNRAFHPYVLDGIRQFSMHYSNGSLTVQNNSQENLRFTVYGVI